jgi:hypothetical protein
MTLRKVGTWIRGALLTRYRARPAYASHVPLLAADHTLQAVISLHCLGKNLPISSDSYHADIQSRNEAYTAGLGPALVTRLARPHRGSRRFRSFNTESTMPRLDRSIYSPDGPAITVPSLPGVPKFGLPSEFQLTFCTIVYRLPSQAPALLAVAWYTFQVSLPSGLWKKLYHTLALIRWFPTVSLPVVARPVVAVRTRQVRPALRPAPLQTRVPTSIPCKKTQAVTRCPAVACGVTEIRLSAVIHSRRAFHHR